MDALLNLDKELLLFLNHCHTPLWDHFFWIYSGIIVWIPLYAAIIYIIVKQGGIRSFWIILALILTIVLCDQISSAFFKPFFERFRPSRDPSLRGLVQLVGNYTGGKYGFISSHAANSFGLAMFISLLFKRKALSLFMFGWAVINAYSRIYLGVHYPGDIIGGMLVGILLAWLVYKIYSRFTYHFVFAKGSNSMTQNAPIGIILITGILSIIMILLSSMQLIKML
ncbi:phosphatase PAP2 family protein [Geofilum sp. OHC36d9]|uniref:phosphatase PAP2 family protein n=1 Tax=Geofilum sp. OHC36d9 TaxID=3458413 RepID=UPI004033285A